MGFIHSNGFFMQYLPQKRWKKMFKKKEENLYDGPLLFPLLISQFLKPQFLSLHLSSSKFYRIHT